MLCTVLRLAELPEADDSLEWKVWLEARLTLTS